MRNFLLTRRCQIGFNHAKWAGSRKTKNLLMKVVGVKVGNKNPSGSPCGKFMVKWSAGKGSQALRKGTSGSARAHLLTESALPHCAFRPSSDIRRGSPPPLSERS